MPQTRRKLSSMREDDDTDTDTDTEMGELRSRAPPPVVSNGGGGGLTSSAEPGSNRMGPSAAPSTSGVTAGAGPSGSQPDTRSWMYTEDNNDDEEEEDMEMDESLDEDEGFVRRYPVRDRKRPCEWWRNKRAVSQRVNIAIRKKEPATYEEAVRGPQSHEWGKAMDAEIEAQLANGTWELGVPPKGAKVLPCRWVYKVKTNPDGSVDRFKARLVAKGFTQREGVDYGELFAPTSQASSFRALLAVAAARGLQVHQLDVATAFLNGELKEEIWMKEPPGYESKTPGMACRLLRSIYGLRQASRCWYDKLCTKFAEIGLFPSKSDPAMFVKVDEKGVILALVHVDDMCVAAKTQEMVNRIKGAIGGLFKVRDLGEIKVFLGMEVTRRENGDITLSQASYVERILSAHGLGDVKPRVLPMAVGTRVTPAKEDVEVLEDPTAYRALVGELNYLAVSTRPDLAFALSVLSRYMAKLTKAAMGMAKGVLRYVAGTRNLGLVFRRRLSEVIDGYSDSDWAGDMNTRRSTTGYIFRVNGTAVSWSSQLQRTVAASSEEAEYQALSAAVREALWLSKLCEDLGVEESQMRIQVDSQGAMNLGNNPITSPRSKHIDVQHHLVRERVASGEVALQYCCTEKMVADVLTKALPEAKFMWCRREMGLDLV
ncbi:hypothetical protein Vafri_9945 [Volvox africanus]|uniref:Reverse transcriptase Ty1/copia-type domain-containing protein n=1 Tax=Volvox africanus TaxID=51714 RepID=A0A8J4BA18_9CHLO|nr:hypothetical protein Vafri_9945 [Volvox africanus]